MSFERAWVLIFALAPILLGCVGVARHSAPRRLMLKAGALLAIILALAEPRLTFFETKVAVAILADTSRSLSPQDLARASALATEIERARGRHWTRVIPFARSARNPAPQEGGNSWNLQYTAGDAGHGTNLEAAIREAIGTLPAGMVRRVVLISDGNENLGSVARAALAGAAARHSDRHLRAGGQLPSRILRVESISLPSLVFSGERFPIDVTVSAPRRAARRVEITAEGKTSGPERRHTRAGRESFARARQRDHGRRGRSGGQDQRRRPGGSPLRSSRDHPADRACCYITQIRAGTETHLRKTLEASQFEVQLAPQDVPDKLDEFQLVIFNNWDLESVPPARKQELEKFVQEGGGLLWIAGERNVYVENKPPEDPLERALPAKLAPPRSPEGTCVILIIDKSSSMEGKKMELARLAAIGVIDNLRPIDQVGVLIFDNSFQWAVPLRRAEDRSLIKRLIAGITPDGGTQIAPALTEAYRRILSEQRRLQAHRAAHRRHLRRGRQPVAIARSGEQPHHHLDGRPGAGREPRVSGEDRDVRQRQVVFSERSVRPRADSAEGRDGAHRIDRGGEAGARGGGASRPKFWTAWAWIAAPPLRGYVRYIAKPTADTMLNVDERDPLLVRWQYGLGRAAVFTSDAKSRWAANWVAWQGFDRLWTNVFRDLLPHAQSSEATGRIRQRERRAGHRLPSEPPNRRAGRHSRYLRVRARRISAPGASQQDRGGQLPRRRSHRTESGAVPRAPAGGVARVSRDRFLSPGRRADAITRPTNFCCARSRDRPAAGSIRR